MNTPRLSVALPVYNGDNYLAEAIDGIVSQTFGDFDLIVSDNASTDGTPDILADFARRDRRVKIFRSAELLTQIDNINRAVRLAPGTWVKLICHDDLMRADCLAEIDAVLAHADERKLGLIANGECHLYANGYRHEPPEQAEPLYLSGREAVIGILGGNGRVAAPALTTATVRKAAFEQVGGIDDRFRYIGDIACWLEVLTRWNYAYIDKPLTTNRIHGSQSAAVMTTQMVSTQNLREFMPDYLHRHAKALNIPRRVRLRARMRPVSEAATKVTCEWLSGRRRTARQMLGRVPLLWLPLLIPLSLRSWLKQRQTHRNLGGSVPRSILYP